MCAQASGSLHRKFQFHWDVLEIILEGKSPIEITDGLGGFLIRTTEEADRFLRNYGYDASDPIQSAEILGNFQEAVSFVRKYFLQPENPEGLKAEIPRKIVEITDVRDLMLMAGMSYPGQMNDSQGIHLRDWAWALFKVVHTISHLDKDVRVLYYTDIQTQILDRFYKVVHRDSEERLYLGEKPEDPSRIDLVSFETKPKKARESILIKLLHKPENVAEDIFDQVGIRFVTPDRVSALRVVKYLKDYSIVNPINIKPSRARNTLIDLKALKSGIGPLLEKVGEGLLGEKDFEAELDKIIAYRDAKEEPNNPHTSRYYRGIHFTARQLIRLIHPLYQPLRDLRKYIKNTSVQDEELKKKIEALQLKYLQREVRFFYPYEVQIMDERSAEENEKGQAAHSEYKRAQVQTAMKRVMGNLLDVPRQ